MSNQVLLNIKDLSFAYDKQRALSGVSLTVWDRDYIGIIGPNGGGKTTLVKLILGLLKPQLGTISLSLERAEIGYLPQGTNVDESFPITVREVVASGLEHGLAPGRRLRLAERIKVSELLDKVGLASLYKRPVGELSGGEFQRALLARAIVSSPRLLVLDEPDTHVDNKFEMELYSLLKDLNKHMAILLVSHDIGMITPYIKSIACVNRNLHYHPHNEISEEQLKVYNCPVEIISHGSIPHRVVKEHKH
jgi:zinc transport system ATP-binding protein